MAYTLVMNKEKYARLTVVLPVETDRTLRRFASATDQGLSEVVRDLLEQPVAMIAGALDGLAAAETGADVSAVLDQADMFLEGAYGEFLASRGASHG